MKYQIIVFNQKIAEKWSIFLYKSVLIFFVVPGKGKQTKLLVNN